MLSLIEATLASKLSHTFGRANSRAWRLEQVGQVALAEQTEVDREIKGEFREMIVVERKKTNLRRRRKATSLGPVEVSVMIDD